jgi:hypothetical protein
MTASGEFPAIIVYASSSKPADSVPSVSSSGVEITKLDDIGKFSAEPPEQTKSLHHGLDLLATLQHLYSGAKGTSNFSNAVDLIGDVSPTSSTIAPAAPPTSPATPKREIKLVTAGSRAADWFTHGIVGITSKDTNHPTVTEPNPLKVEPLSPETVDIHHDFVHFEESPTCVEQSLPVPAAETTTTNVKCIIPC